MSPGVVLRGILRTIVLAGCAGVVLALIFLILGVISNPAGFFKELKRPLPLLGELTSLFAIGFGICFAFGTPVLIFIEKYFGRHRYRYLSGGVVAGLFVLLVLTQRNDWRVVPVFAGLGFLTGLLYTFASRGLDRLIDRLSNRPQG